MPIGAAETRVVAAFRFTPDAVADLDDIWRFIASDNRAAADQVEEAIVAACEALARNPLQGHVRPDLTKLPVRFWTLEVINRASSAVDLLP